MNDLLITDWFSWTIFNLFLDEAEEEETKAQDEDETILLSISLEIPDASDDHGPSSNKEDD